MRWTEQPDRRRRVTFTCEPQQKGPVKHTLVHDRLPDETSAARFREGWAPIISPLKTFLESGPWLPELRALAVRGRPR